jgi:hypothetical protein
MSTLEDALTALSPFARWEEGEISAREAVRLLVAEQLIDADATYKAAEQRRKGVRDQLTTLMLEIREPLTIAGLVLEYRDGSLGASYPFKKVDSTIKGLMEVVRTLKANPLPNDGSVADDLPAYRISQLVIDELLLLVQELAASREERPRAGALYVTREEKPRERRKEDVSC